MQFFTLTPYNNLKINWLRQIKNLAKIKKIKDVLVKKRPFTTMSPYFNYSATA
jgi:hypothetical protein